jgi:hypothetical protein
MLAGQMATGASVSLTVTLKLQLVVLPEASVAVQLTLLVPLANVLPLVGLQVTVTPEQLSVAMAGAKLTFWLHWPDAVLVTTLTGQVITGGSVSLTVTLKLQLAVFPLASSAVQVTMLVPLAKALPLVGLQVTVALEQLSVAVAAKLTI